MNGITTYVLDTSRGRPAAGVEITLECHDPSGGWQLVGRGATDEDGSLRTLTRDDRAPSPGVYRLVCDTGPYFASRSERSFYPRVVIVFEVVASEAHYHLPLMISPYGYATYRGS
jgi:5-hydroxyisourate hydrolase